ncbi:MAG: TerC family protein [Verrucomicrobia bacterium]|jgi:tellurite resistance protein TerC|nr:TerC family protein [Verrucomicrobiota bacterium]
MDLFPFANYWWFYAGFTVFVIGVLALDLGVFHRNAHVVEFREALTWSIIWVALAVAFGFAFGEYAQYRFANDARLLAIPGFDPNTEAQRAMLQFFTGYIVEKALSVDNIFVFVVVFTFFNIPAKYQHRVLFYGIIGALVFRCIFIAIGAALVQYHWVVVLFGVFLILTGIKVLLAPEKPLEPDKNPVMKLLMRVLPVTPHLDGQKFFTRHNGAFMATPLFVALVFIEISDIVFAVDSVPAIFAITKEPMIVFTSNIFAILGLRAMFFLLAGVVHKFRLLKYGLGLVLVFVGLKMVWLNEAFGGKFPIGWSLAIISTLIGGSILLSFLIPEKKSHDAEK